MERPHEYIYFDEAGFNFTKRRRRGRNVIGNRAIVGVPGQCGGNATLCAAITNQGFVHHHANLGPYNTYKILISLNHMRDALLGQQDEHPIYVVVWDNVSFHRALQVKECFNTNQGFINLCLPPYSPFLNPIEEFFSSWRWKVYERQPYSRVNVLQGMRLVRHRCDGMPSLNTAHQGFFPPLPGQKKMGMFLYFVYMGLLYTGGECMAFCLLL